MDKCKANAWSTKNEVATMVAGKFMIASYNTHDKEKEQCLLLCTVLNLGDQALTYAQALE